MIIGLGAIGTILLGIAVMSNLMKGGELGGCLGSFLIFILILILLGAGAISLLTMGGAF
jgi:hypothetical protein